MSEIRANTISNAAGTGAATLTGQYAAKAWVNFNGTGTVAIRESGNVSSITDNGTGNYGLSLTSALADVNGAIAVGKTNQVSNAGNATGVVMNTASTITMVQYEAGSSVDTTHNYITITR